MADKTEPEDQVQNDATGNEGVFQQFMDEVKAIEKKDSTMTKEEQVKRLNRPGSTYFNLNPFEVLQVSTEADLNEVKRAYKKLSILVHPDKNPDDRERAQKAFDAINKAYKMFQDEEQVQFCKDVAEEARKQLETRLDEKRKKAKKEGKDKIDEDDADKYQQQLRNHITKLFADIEIKKKEIEEKEERERKRQREEEEAEQEKAKREKEWKEQWDADRTQRVDSWRNFQTSKSKKKGKTSFKPPKLKQEQRNVK